MSYPITPALLSNTRQYRGRISSAPKSPTAVVPPMANYRQTRLVPGTNGLIKMSNGSNGLSTLNGYAKVSFKLLLF